MEDFCEKQPYQGFLVSSELTIHFVKTRSEKVPSWFIFYEDVMMTEPNGSGIDMVKLEQVKEIFEDLIKTYEWNRKREEATTTGANVHFAMENLVELSTTTTDKDSGHLVTNLDGIGIEHAPKVEVPNSDQEIELLNEVQTIFNEEDSKA